MIVLTMQDQESMIDNSIDSFVGFKGYYFKKTYEVVSQEYDEKGDAEKRGWEVEKSSIFYCLESLLKHPDVAENWLEWSGSHPRPGDWINSEPHQDMYDGKYTSYSLFIEREDGLPLTPTEMRYIGKTLGVQGTKNIQGE